MFIFFFQPINVFYESLFFDYCELFLSWTFLTQSEKNGFLPYIFVIPYSIYFRKVIEWTCVLLFSLDYDSLRPVSMTIYSLKFILFIRSMDIWVACLLSKSNCPIKYFVKTLQILTVFLCHVPLIIHFSEHYNEKVMAECFITHRAELNS